ncbi:MAG: TauD/TfdA family dioxygenase, partial [Nitrospinales bacterium]
QDKFGRRLIHIYDRDSTKQIKDGARYHQTHESGAIHTDNVNIPEPWDYLLVGCVAPAMIGGENIIVCGFSVHNHLEKKAPEDLAVLRENFWWEFRGISNELYSAPILTYDDAGQPLFRYLRTYLESAHIKADQPLTPQQRRAMDALDATLSMSEFQIKHRLQAGQILVANDNQIFHDRECFVDFPDSVSVEEKGAGKNGILRRTLERTWIKKPQI